MRGIDIYQGDGDPLKKDPAAAYKDSDFVIVKATQGTSYKYTSYFSKMIKKVLNDGKLGGAYHYAGGGDPIKEADYFISIVKPYIGKIILCLDWQSIQNKKFGNKTWCTTFINRVKDKIGITCFLYTGLDGCSQNKSLAGKVPLWFAGYPTNKNSWTVPNFSYKLGDWKKYTIWQFTSGQEKVDRNTTEMTKKDWLNYATPKIAATKTTAAATTIKKVDFSKYYGKISNSGKDEHNKLKGGTAGDQTKHEWEIINWYNRPWNYVLRYPKEDVRELIAQLAIEAANNNKIGYDQNQRSSYWSQLQKANYRPSKITIACQADCSAGVIANTKAVGYLKNITALKNISATYTGDMRSAYKKAGFNILTDSKYLKGYDYLLPGDILLYENHHTATNLGIGKNTIKKVIIQKKPDLKATSQSKYSISGTKTPNRDKIKDGKVTAAKLYVRQGPGTNYLPLRNSAYAIINKNTKVQICDSILDKNKNIWYYVRINSIYGYCSAKYIKGDS